MIKTSFVSVIIGILLLSCNNNTSDIISVGSPDGHIKILVKADKQGRPTYEVHINDQVVVKPSRLGISLLGNGMDFTKNLILVNETQQEINETYTMLTGKKSQCVNHANEKTIIFKNDWNNKLHIVFRAYNDGVAFRYKLFNKKPDTLLAETSTFRIDPGSTTWIKDYAVDYEMFYTERPISNLNAPQKDTVEKPWRAVPHVKESNQDDSYLCPGLFRTTGNHWLLASDAAVFSNYPAMQLVHNGKGEMQFHIPNQNYYATPRHKGTWEELVMAEDTLVEASPELTTPWRALIIGDDLGDIVESIMIENLNPPCELEDTSWIEPGIAVFPWWGNSIANDDPEILKQYVDMAAEMQWEYLEFDIGLLGNQGGYAANYWRDIDYIPEVINYAAKKGIEVYGWDERKYLDTPEKREDIFGMYEKWGVAGIKIDYINSDKQEAMAFREVVTRDAAKHHLMVSFHGEITPRGNRRTFPNIMTQEGVRGAEYYKFAPEKGIPNPIHNCTLPFTRNVIGPMDYTPTTFSASNKKTSYAHELALPVVYESGWTCMADKPDKYLHSPAKEYLQKLVAAWDDIHFIAGYPGKYFAVARRKGKNWYVAGINAGPKRWVPIHFDFIKQGSYQVKIYLDNTQPSAENAGELVHNMVTIEKGDRIRFLMEKNGGFAFIIKNSYKQ